MLVESTGVPQFEKYYTREKWILSGKRCINIL